MVGDQVVRSEEDIELVKIELVGAGLEAGDVEDDVEVFSPVVDLGDVRLAECVFDGQVMEVKVAAEPVLKPGTGVLVGPEDIDPDQPGLSARASSIRLSWPVGMKDAAAVTVGELEHGSGAAIEPPCGWPAASEASSLIARASARRPRCLLRASAAAAFWYSSNTSISTRSPPGFSADRAPDRRSERAEAVPQLGIIDIGVDQADQVEAHRRLSWRETCRPSGCGPTAFCRRCRRRE